jgi:uncharacterized membrane protein YwaF
MKKLFAILFFVTTAMSFNAHSSPDCAQEAVQKISTSFIMDHFDDFYEHQHQCVPVQIRVKNGICSFQIKVRMIEDPISDAPEFKIEICEDRKNDLSY